MTDGLTWAAPPLLRAAATLGGRTDTPAHASFSAARGLPAAHAFAGRPSMLDLRPPPGGGTPSTANLAGIGAVSATAPSAKSAAAAAIAPERFAEFPSFVRHPSLEASREAADPGSDARGQVLGQQIANQGIRSRIDMFARQVKREGLPVARLWENNAALVHLGLNPKGKPGLWIVQKIQ